MFRFAFEPAIVRAIWMRNFTVYRRTWTMNLLPNFFEPLLYLLGMGFGLGAYLAGPLKGEAYVRFIGPGLMAAAAMNGASFETTYNMFVRMTFSRLYDAYLGTPAMVADIALGELAWATTRALIYGVAFLLVLCGFSAAGVEVITSSWAWLLPFALALIGAVFALIGQLFTSLIRMIDLYSYYYTLFLTPLFLFSGIFFDVGRFPHGETIAWFTPLYHGVRLCRSLAYGEIGHRAAVSALWLLVLSAVLLAIVPRLLERRMVR